ncbi:restriction endonuclease PLD domain-containing protein [Clostridium formicaceticum]|uniref:NgoFVII restriction endonuclease n=1 Tax=Clostridium formicaceticum TaxID=1497 RepID=A0AAC9RQI0_9CLOT|nr:restriction endonuclease PLD domain-containing protein [Clostridium formicaceticum]AOY74723.1 hypothetical protein BJL90_01390 [Clostridium formicaceticum]ARE89108.1 NgoFVII restriction endonuclease [Clostridium formicaceticum]
MEFLFSNYPPMRTKMHTFYDTFYSLLPQTRQLDIAVGYITSDSLVELQKAVELNNIERLNLAIGMHYLDKFTEVEYKTAIDLNTFLTSNNCGEVRLVTPFRFHGKMYTYSDEQGAIAGIIGSNNLSSIVQSNNRIYETAILINNSLYAQQMNLFINDLIRTSTENIANLDIHQFRKANPLLENHEHVEYVDTTILAQCLASRTEISFEIPIKGAEVSPQSNLNVFFGRGRVGKNGLVKPRHWYEVELIVSKNITSSPHYPKSQTDSAVFDVITDDGWKFKCKVSGDYSKNFRSENDLKILGKWLKGRLENAGALAVGEPVTQETLRRYGRDTFTLTKTEIPNLWYLDFGVMR